MQNDTYARWANVLKTMGHPVRIRIIEALLEDGKCVTKIGGCLDLPQATVSQHLSLLRGKGIVQQERCGSQVKYSICDRNIEEIIKMIKGVELT